jgi:hypothetical protein
MVSKESGEICEEQVIKSELTRRRNMEILFIVYWIAGYWAVTRTIDANKTFIYTGNALFLRRAAIGLFFGWILIPWAIIKMFVNN